MVERLTTSPSQRPGGRPDAPADGWTPRSLWFTGPLADEEERLGHHALAGERRASRR